MRVSKLAQKFKDQPQPFYGLLHMRRFVMHGDIYACIINLIIVNCFSGVSYAFSDIQAVFGVSSPRGLKAKPPTIKSTP